MSGSAGRTLITRILFAVRLMIFIGLPFVLFSPDLSLILICLLPGIWIIDFLLGNTLWFSSSARTYFCQILYLALLFMVYLLSGKQHSHLIIGAVLLLIALSSDAISNSHRWKILIPVAAVFGLLYVVFHPRLTAKQFDFENVYMPWHILVYAFVPLIACLARLFFPRTKDLLHTSLDYPPVRLEVLSYGMKRTAAAGIKRA